MPETTQTAILVVANRTGATPALLAEVHSRAGTARFGLMVPPEAEHDWTLDDALRLVGRAAGAEVAAVEPGAEAATTVHDLVATGEYDEIILSTVPEHHLRWHHHKLPDRILKLGIPVTVIPTEIEKWGPIQGFPDEWAPKEISPAAVAGFGNY